MSDLISRQALLDKFEPWLKVKDYNDGELNMLKAILYEIRFMPSAQPDTYWKEQCQSYEQTINKLRESLSTQPEIIRCKDCKYWHSGSCEYPEHAVNCQDYWVGDIDTEAEHFCGYAERREVTT